MVVAIFRLVPENKEVGASIQQMLVQTRGFSLLLVVARRKLESWSFHLVGAGKRGCSLLLVVARRKSGSWSFHQVGVGKD